MSRFQTWNMWVKELISGGLVWSGQVSLDSRTVHLYTADSNRCVVCDCSGLSFATEKAGWGWGLIDTDMKTGHSTHL